MEEKQIVCPHCGAVNQVASRGGCLTIILYIAAAIGLFFGGLPGIVLLIIAFAFGGNTVFYCKVCKQTIEYGEPEENDKK